MCVCVCVCEYCLDKFGYTPLKLTYVLLPSSFDHID